MPPALVGDTTTVTDDPELRGLLYQQCVDHWLYHHGMIAGSHPGRRILNAFGAITGNLHPAAPLSKVSANRAPGSPFLFTSGSVLTTSGAVLSASGAVLSTSGATAVLFTSGATPVVVRVRSAYSTNSAMVCKVSELPATSRVVAIDSRQPSRSSRIFSLGPIRAVSSIRAVGTAAAASSLRPAR